MIVLISEVFEDFILLSFSVVVPCFVCLFIHLFTYFYCETANVFRILPGVILEASAEGELLHWGFSFSFANSLTTWKPS